MQSLIAQLKENNLVATDLNYSNGTLIDDISKNLGTISGNVSWSKANRTKSILFPLKSTGGISYADTAANRLSSGECTINLYGNFNYQKDCRLLCKRAASTMNYEFGYNATEGFFLGTKSGSVITRTISATIKNIKLISITLVNGNKAKLYLNTNYIGEFNDVSSIINDTSNPTLFIGDYYTGINLSCGNHISRVVLINKSLSPEQILQIYDELNTSYGNGDPKVGKFYQKPYIGTKPLLHLPLNKWYTAQRTSQSNSPALSDINNLEDWSGSGQIIRGYNLLSDNDGIIFPTALKFNRRSRSHIQSTSALTNLIGSNNQFGVSLWFNCNDISTYPTLFWSANTNLVMQCSDVGRIQVYIGGTSVFYNTLVKQNVWNHVFFQKTGETTGELYWNGEKVTEVSGALSATPATIGDLIITNNTVGTNSFTGSMQDFRIYGSNLTADEIKKIYWSGGLRHNVYLPMDNANVSIGVFGKYGQITNTPFYVDEPTIRKAVSQNTLTEEFGRKWIKLDGVANDGMYQPIRCKSNQIFGTWIWKHRNNAGSPGYSFMIIGNKPYYNPSSGNVLDSINFYRIYYNPSTLSMTLFSVTPGGIATNLCSVPLGLTDSFAITRQQTGVFTLYTNNGSIWVQPTATTNTNPTVSDLNGLISNTNTITAQSTASRSQFSDFRFLEGILNLNKLNELYPTG